MAHYVVGDIQGCFEGLQALLHRIQFNPRQDRLYCLGDVVNRGPTSLEVLRFLKKLPGTQIVLGNHDLHALAVYAGVRHVSLEDTLDALLSAPDCDELMLWLRQQRFALYSKSFDALFVHAGILPGWSVAYALDRANEVEQALRAKDWPHFLADLFEDEPKVWHDDLSGEMRLRCLVNVFTRLRFCKPDGEMEFYVKKAADQAPGGYAPWYSFHIAGSPKFMFGHWAALEGRVQQDNIFALDTGYVWGGELTALRLEDGQRFSVKNSNA